jgi:hypothetical protein
MRKKGHEIFGSKFYKLVKFKSSAVLKFPIVLPFVRINNNSSEVFDDVTLYVIILLFS